MDKDTALAVFRQLDRARTPNENAHDEDDKASTPTYAVQLDASFGVDTEEREYQVLVSEGPWGESRGGWLYVLEVAGEHEVDVVLRNASIELR